jgi:uncharacterized membrane protein YsdA (DUF1294 family)
VRTLSYFFSGGLLALAAALGLEGGLALPLLFAWLIGINAFTFLFYAVDKLNAKWVEANPAGAQLMVRIPEWSLLFLALAGGSPAAGLAMVLFRHKTNKQYFIFRLIVIVGIQATALYAFRDKIP